MLEQTFICKHYRNLTKALPFVYITSRCDPGLQSHTTTKTMEEFLLHAITALVHDGALSICDGAKPDGTLSDDVYAVGGPIRSAWEISRNYEEYVGGPLDTNVSVWFPSHSKYNDEENGSPVCVEDDDKRPNERFIQDKLDICNILRTENIPFDVLPSKSLAAIPNGLLVISNVASILYSEMAAIERFVSDDGNVYLSGHIGHSRLLGIAHKGETEYDMTYMSCTPEGAPLFGGFTEQNPMAIQGKQQRINVIGDAKVLATMTLPYTMTGKRAFAAIHSNPPGIRTDWPAMVLKRVGKGTVLYAAAQIEPSKPLISRRAFAGIRSLMGSPKFTSKAPGYVEILSGDKGDRRYFAALNRQEQAPYVPMQGTTISLPYDIRGAHLAATNEQLKVDSQDGRSTIHLPTLDVFLMIELERWEAAPA